MNRELHILAGVVLIVLLSLFAVSLFATPSLAVSAEPVSPDLPEIHTSNFFAKNIELECGQEFDTCGLAVECCDGLYCTEDDVCVKCVGVGESCSSGAGGVSCCPGNYCYMGSCEEQTLHFCSDSENGPDYHSAGSASGEHEGIYEAYSDYCLDSKTVVDYYCQVNNEYSPVLAASVSCPNGCSEGACK